MKFTATFSELPPGEHAIHIHACRQVRVALRVGWRALLSDGASMVVHEKADDYKSDPAGNAGKRIACGVIKASGS